MKKTIVAFIILTFFSACGQQSIPHTSQQQDKIASDSASKVDQDFIKILTLLQESNLRNDTLDKHEFRFYYFPSFESYKFFKLNYADSTLVFKEFVTKKPDGSGENKLISSKTLKFFPKDFKRLEIAIDKSLFWSLQSETPKLSIDGSLYIYESRQPIPENLRSIEKDYHIVKYNSPTNADFINLGQFFLFLTGHKNTYHN